jgi:hypothetical protein
MPERTWTNEEVLNEALRIVVVDIYRSATLSAESVREAALDPNAVRLRDRLVDLQKDAVIILLTLIDGAVGPTVWPELALVRKDTGEQLSEDLCWEFAAVEGDYILETEPPAEDD